MSDSIERMLDERDRTIENLKTRAATLRVQRDYARDAAAHFAHCRWCGEDGIREDLCREGYEYAVKLKIYVPDK